MTGKMLGGRAVNRQTITREEALIAHTRSNSYFLMRENDLGSIQPGKLADLVVMDQDYLTIPVDQIKNIKPVMTMVGRWMGALILQCVRAQNVSDLISTVATGLGFAAAERMNQALDRVRAIA